MIWSNLNGPNSFTSSLETMPTKIIHFSKYVNVVPRGGVPRDIVKSPQRRFRGEGLHRAAKVRSQWGEGAFLEEGLYRGVEELPNTEKGCLWRREISFGKICPWGRVKLWPGMHCIPENDVPRDWMQHCKEKRMGLPG